MRKPFTPFTRPFQGPEQFARTSNTYGGWILTQTDNPGEGGESEIRKIVIGMIYESRTNDRVGARGENERQGMKGGTAKTGVEIYGPATDASPKDDIFLSLRI